MKLLLKDNRGIMTQNRSIVWFVEVQPEFYRTLHVVDYKSHYDEETGLECYAFHGSGKLPKRLTDSIKKVKRIL